ncbi:MAG: pilus assembly PilX N-terminal domain-containing protein [Desulfobacterales bacterium]
MKTILYPFEDDRGSILPVVLMFLLILAITGTTATVVTTTDLRIGSNLKTSNQAVYVAEAGLEEARGRMKVGAVRPISDGHPAQTQWRVFIGTAAKTTGKGYDNGNAMHTLTASSQAIPVSLDYSVGISHQTDAAGNILYYGDTDNDGIYERNTTTGENIYLVSSTGYSSDSQRTIEAEISRTPPITVPGALYVAAWTTIQGNVNINGNDSCGGGGGDDKPGIASSQPAGTIWVLGNPTIDGDGASDPNITYDEPELHIEDMLEGLAASADFSYSLAAAGVQNDTTVPGPGDGWGVPTLGATLQDPSSCAVNNIISYDTHGYGLTFSGIEGCGILLVDGDLEVHASFNWYGVVAVTGSIIFTGGGNRNITGAIVSGGSVLGDIIGGNVNLVYCSTAIADQTENRPYEHLSWKENT